MIKKYLQDLLKPEADVDKTFIELRRMFLIDVVKAIIDDLAFLEIESLKACGKPQILHFIRLAKASWQDELERLLI